jgi:formylglycine-generating enzyme required for sulfatase activity
MLVLILAAFAEPVPVPGAVFRQGGGAAPDETPQRDVTLSAYRIDRTEVSVSEFEAFVALGAWARAEWWSADGWAWAKIHPGGAGSTIRASGRTGDHPVVAVTWYEADAYCRSKGGSLPTEAQWEHAACHDSGSRYPWGDSEEFEASWYKEGKWGQVEGVKTEPAAVQDPTLASPFGLLHAAGNVWEWTTDTYDADAYSGGPAKDPVSTSKSRWHTLRGGSFMNLPSYCTCTHREPAGPAEVRLTAGFRCAYPP